jgi:uncharacterized protein
MTVGAASLIRAVRAGDLQRVRALVGREPAAARLRDDAGVSLLLLAAYHRHAELVELLRPLAGPLDVFEAASVGDLPRLRGLLDADPALASAFAPDGFYPLGLAAFFGHAEAVRLLLASGADVGAVARNPQRVQAIHAAAAARRADIVADLLEHGADPDAVQQAGLTPLMAAARHGDEDMAGRLLGAGADPGRTDDRGRSARDHARAAGHGHLDALLAVQDGTPQA